jgi:hypothetical protein
MMNTLPLEISCAENLMRIKFTLGPMHIRYQQQLNVGQ